MEMPTKPEKGQSYMDFRIWDDGTVEARIGPEETDYKAIPVPSHGRLIDVDEYRDEFMDGVYAECYDDPDNIRANSIIDIFDSAPTIIPAEDGDLEAQREYEAAIENAQYCERYEPTYDPETGAL